MTGPLRAVLVHGLWGGAWVWDAVRERLSAAGVASSAVDLPLTTLADDVASVRRLLDEVTDDVLLVGHSYGGAVVTAAGEHPRVRRLLYVASFPLDAGESIARNCAGHDLPASPLDLAMRGMVRGDAVVPDPAVVRPLLFGPDVPDAVADAAIARLRPSATALFRGTPDAVAWRSRPASYVVCTDDQVVHPERQRVLAARTGEVVEWASDHSPETSRPDRLATLVADLATLNAR
ncbi:MAG: alpha/beta fold hydrolase [Jatrophihabitans sp.]|uniref:alpha/beta fold hydrolase n=1 Tax=Jatrophihabitans sp. TaxID=1932789 RepID=UPI003F7E2A6F